MAKGYWVLIGMLLCLLVPWGVLAAPPSGAPVVLGGSLPLSGGSSSAGADLMKGANMAVDELNAAGGVLGRPIKLQIEDDASDPSQGASIAHELIMRGNIAVMLGPYNSNVAAAFVDVTRKAKIPVFLNGSSATSVLRINATEGDPWVFRHYADTDSQGFMVANYVIKAMRLKNIAILFENTDYGKGLEQSFRKNVTSLGGTIAISQSYELGSVDFSAQITRIKAIQGVDALYLASTIGDGPQILNTAHDMGLKVQMIGSGGLINNSLFQTVRPEALNGMVIVSPYEASTSNVMGKKFAEVFFNKFKQYPGANEAQSYDAVHIVVDAIKTAGKLDPLAIRDAIWHSHAKSLIGQPGYTLSFDGWGQSYQEGVVAKYDAYAKKRVVIGYAPAK
jgi:branched-chain amino acid transport system substrate-binding protein